MEVTSALLKTVEPQLSRIESEVAMILAHQNALLESLREATSLSTPTTEEDTARIQRTFAKIPGYVARLKTVQANMRNLTARTEKVKKEFCS